ncbi:unnamed protein product [Brassica rapa]|uniref:Uncharacterized protein n=2 Tax=Brassica TaxID=3705 RepID=A0A8D9M127_BRACM|nr:unnamed protein product [Brassica napus]CAG7894401.1 unnamed protein product [Brassica rapa]
MYPTWDNDAVDVSVKNLVELCVLNLNGSGPKSAGQPKEESRAPKKARTEAGTSEDPIEPPLESSAARNGIMRENIELMFKEMTKVVTAGIGQCVKEIKFLRDRMEAMKKIVGINKKDTLEMKIGTAGIGQGVKEIKLLGDRMEAMEKIVGINKKNTDHNELQLTVSELDSIPTHIQDGGLFCSNSETKLDLLYALTNPGSHNFRHLLSVFRVDSHDLLHSFHPIPEKLDLIYALTNPSSHNFRHLLEH